MTIRSKDYTLSVHGGIKIDPATGAIAPSICPSSTFKQDLPGIHKGYDYSRAKNPTRDQLEYALAKLEDSKYCLSFASGLSAIQSIFQLCQAKDRIIIGDDVYGGTRRLCEKILSKFNLDFQFVNMTDGHSFESTLEKSKKTKNNVKLVWIETPTNPMLQVIDLSYVSKLCVKYNCIMVVDNTFASPIFQKPMEYNADIVMHSTTKYLSGHGDLIGGAVMCNSQTIYQNLKLIQYGSGAIPSVFDCFLLLRSLQTLAIRMKKHHDNAVKIAKYLSDHPKVSKVIFPGLDNHPQYDLAKRQMLGFSGMISFYYQASETDTHQMATKTKFFILAESLGSCKSMINHPQTMTHASVDNEVKKKLGIHYNLLRLSVGIEDSDDLIADLDQAL